MVEKKQLTEADFDMKEVNKYGEVYVKFAREVRGVDVTFYGNWQKDFAKLLIEIADLNPDKEWRTIVDIGCATCLNLRAIDELGIFSKFIGIDHSKYLLDLGKSLYDFGTHGEFHVTPSWKLNQIEDEEVDLITCTHVLEHLPDEDKLHQTLKEFKRILHPDGKILIIIPCSEEENKDFTKRTDKSPLHYLMHTSKWWTNVFGKYFKSESFKTRQLFKKTKLRPDRANDKSFSEEYKSWNIFKYIHK
jgi:ubiquinone/menaquinone biosynthesis C-methylase UbiE